MARLLTDEDVKSLPPVIAVDFDGTLVGFTYSGIGEADTEMFDLIKELKSAGAKIILWTCRDNETEDRELDAAVEFCRVRGLEFDAVNDNIEEVKNLTQNNTRKIYADIYIDDKALFDDEDIVQWARYGGLL